VDKISSESAADKAVETATDMMEDLHDGLVREDKEPQAIAEAKALFETALEYYRREGKPHKAAEQVANLGYMARHVEDNPDQAQTLFAEAAALFEQLGDKRRRLATLMQWGEIDPALAAAEQAVAEALDAGLPEDLHHTEDPRRLAFAKRLAGDLDGSLTLYEALLEDALAPSRNARAAMLLRDIARIYEDDKNDHIRATSELERALALAEEAKDKEGTAMALLRLTDVHVERGQRKRALELFQRVEKMRGLPGYQRKMIGPMRYYFDTM